MGVSAAAVRAAPELAVVSPTGYSPLPLGAAVAAPALPLGTAESSTAKSSPRIDGSGVPGAFTKIGATTSSLWAAAAAPPAKGIGGPGKGIAGFPTAIRNCNLWPRRLHPHKSNLTNIQMKTTLTT